MRESTLGTILSALAVLTGVAAAQEYAVAKGKKFVAVMTIDTESKGFRTRSEAVTETKVTDVSATAITYDQRTTTKVFLGETAVDSPPVELKGQVYTRSARLAAGPAGGDAKTDEPELEVSAGPFKGKLRLIHSKSDAGSAFESWISKNEFETEVPIAGGRKVKVKCIYSKHIAVSKDSTTNSEMLSLAEFPLISVWMSMKHVQPGISNNSVTVLRDLTDDAGTADGAKAEPPRSTPTPAAEVPKSTKLPVNPFAAAVKGDWLVLVASMKPQPGQPEPQPMIAEWRIDKVEERVVSLKELQRPGNEAPVSRVFNKAEAPSFEAYLGISDGGKFEQIRSEDAKRKIGGNEFSCKKIAFVVKEGDSKSTYAVWISDEIKGGGLVAMEMTMSQQNMTIVFAGEVVGYGNGAKAEWGMTLAEAEANQKKK